MEPLILLQRCLSPRARGHNLEQFEAVVRGRVNARHDWLTPVW